MTTFSLAHVIESQQFDRELLEGVAKTTGGTFFHALDSAGLDAVYRRLDQIEPVLSDERQAYRAQPFSKVGRHYGMGRRRQG